MEEKKYTIEEFIKAFDLLAKACRGIAVTAQEAHDNFFNNLENEKPENQPTIVKSGETWVAEYQGVDYLFIPDGKTIKIGTSWDAEGFEDLIKSGLMKPISEIEITDDIAKLRPMVIDNNGNGSVLYGVIKTESMHQIHTVLAGLGNYPISILKLATVKDLTEGV